jgi:rsbT co-antagonist protein RsbR
MSESQSIIFPLIEKYQRELLQDWLHRMGATSGAGLGVAGQAGDTADQAQRFLEQLRQCGRSGRNLDIGAPEWAPLRDLLEDLSRDRATQGFRPSETATFVFSLKQPLFALLRREIRDSADRLADEIWTVTQLLDQIGLYTVEVYQRTREELIIRQQQELMELSTPVVELWEGILALPLIGTLDSARTQIVMESLLERIVASGAEMAIIDITGVPTVDTLVAQHLIKTISAARLMGADCILSGIRPQIAQTIVHLGLELNVVSKATMSAALALALRRSGRTISARTPHAAQESQDA